ncbi:hypothetical protein NST54_14090 [Caldifermentibacillus hisashii]
MATSPILVTILRWRVLYFDDEGESRHHFEARNLNFWRRALFSSSF